MNKPSVFTWDRREKSSTDLLNLVKQKELTSGTLNGKLSVHWPPNTGLGHPVQNLFFVVCGSLYFRPWSLSESYGVDSGPSTVTTDLYPKSLKVHVCLVGSPEQFYV